jgi:hypothetical protein
MQCVLGVLILLLLSQLKLANLHNCCRHDKTHVVGRILPVEPTTAAKEGTLFLFLLEEGTLFLFLFEEGTLFLFLFEEGTLFLFLLEGGVRHSTRGRGAKGRVQQFICDCSMQELV